MSRLNNNMKLWEAVVREPGPGTQEKRVRIGASSAQEAPWAKISALSA